jgi:dUTP pyrophosphatase
MLRVKVLNPTGIKLPERATPKSSAKDIRANLKLVENKHFYGFAVLGYVLPEIKTGILDDNTPVWGESTYGKNLVLGLIMHPNSRVLIPSGLNMELPANYHMDVRPRSGLALKYGLEVVNSPGLIDEDYRGDVGVILKNGGDKTLIIIDGERIAQIQLMPDFEFGWDNVDELSDTKRGDGGFNSTGTK